MVPHDSPVSVGKLASCNASKNWTKGAKRCAREYSATAKGYLLLMMSVLWHSVQVQSVVVERSDKLVDSSLSNTCVPVARSVIMVFLHGPIAMGLEFAPNRTHIKLLRDLSCKAFRAALRSDDAEVRAQQSKSECAGPVSRISTGERGKHQSLNVPSGLLH